MQKSVKTVKVGMNSIQDLTQTVSKDLPVLCKMVCSPQERSMPALNLMAITILKNMCMDTGITLIWKMIIMMVTMSVRMDTLEDNGTTLKDPTLKEYGKMNTALPMAHGLKTLKILLSDMS